MENSNSNFTKWFKIIAVIACGIEAIRWCQLLPGLIFNGLFSIVICYALMIASMVFLIIGILKKRQLLYIGAGLNLISDILSFACTNTIPAGFTEWVSRFMLPLSLLIIVFISQKKKSIISFCWFIPALLYIVVVAASISNTTQYSFESILIKLNYLVLYLSFGLFINTFGSSERITDAKKKRRTAFCVAALLVIAIGGVYLGVRGGLFSSMFSGDGRGDSAICKVCGRKIEGISTTGMCSNCYENYQWGQKAIGNG